MNNKQLFDSVSFRIRDRNRSRRLALSLLVAVFTGGFLHGCASDSATAVKVDVAEEERLRAEAGAALESAHAAIKEAKAVGWDASAVEGLLKQAEDAFAKGQYRQAAELAGQIQQFAIAGANRQQLIAAQEILDKVRGLSGLNDDHLAQIGKVEKAIAAGDGRQALELIRQLRGALEAADIDYTVVLGDSLWGISGKREIYANPYQWPLIYKANKDQIKDADLIHPGQKFDIRKHPAQTDVDAAVEHARTRGAWSLGGQEASDKAYLAK